MAKELSGKYERNELYKSGEGKKGTWHLYRLFYTISDGTEKFAQYFGSAKGVVGAVKGLSSGDLITIAMDENNNVTGVSVRQKGKGSGSTSGTSGTKQSGAGAFRHPDEIIKQDALASAVELFVAAMAHPELSKQVPTKLGQISISIMEMAAKFVDFVKGKAVAPAAPKKPVVPPPPPPPPVEDDQPEPPGCPDDDNDDDDIPF